VQETAFLQVTQNIFAASSVVLLALTKPRAVVHLFSLRHILFFFLGSPSWHPGFLKLLPELIAKLLPEQCPRRWGIAFCGERWTNRWVQLTRMANKMERAGANISMGGQRGNSSCSQAGNHSSFRDFELGLLEAGKFLGGSGEKGVAWGW